MIDRFDFSCADGCCGRAVVVEGFGHLLVSLLDSGSSGCGNFQSLADFQAILGIGVKGDEVVDGDAITLCKTVEGLALLHDMHLLP